VIAHVGGVPVEEILPSVTGAGAGLLLAPAWLILHLRPAAEAAELTDDLGGSRAIPGTRPCGS
jgi:hypothetical protein